jgi:hypothetical protein
VEINMRRVGTLAYIVRLASAVLLVGPLLGGLLPGLAGSTGSEPAGHAARTPPTLGLADSVIETFHDSETNQCGTTKVHIDSPVRAFEDQNNVIHLTVSDPSARGWQWTGQAAAFTGNPTTATLDCAPIMTGTTGNNDISSFDQKTWIQGLYYRGSTVYAYGHQDYFGTRTAEPGCHRAGTIDGLPYCWYASIPVWMADAPKSGVHLSFSRSAAPPGHVAIYPHVRYPGHESTPLAGWIGYGTPSNIIRGRKRDGSLDGYYYMFAYTNSGFANQPTGVCLFRSPDPSDRTSWRAWNGNASRPAYTQRMSNPYTATNTPCAVVNPGTFQSYVRSVQWHKPSRHYIAIFRDQDGVHYATSPDLLTWNPSRTLLVSEPAAANYPVVIDFDGGDWGDDNFDRIHSNGRAYLFYRKSIASGHTQITRRKLDVTNYAADPPGPGNRN